MSTLSSKMCRLKTNHTPSLLRRRSPFSRHTLMMKIVHSKRQRWWPRLKGCEVGLLIRRERRQQVWWVVVENPKHLRTRGTFCFSSAPSPLRAELREAWSAVKWDDPSGPSNIITCWKPISRTFMQKPQMSSNWNVSVDCFSALLGFRHRKHLVRFRKTSWFGLKYLFWDGDGLNSGEK